MDRSKTLGTLTIHAALLFAFDGTLVYEFQLLCRYCA